MARAKQLKFNPTRGFVKFSHLFLFWRRVGFHLIPIYDITHRFGFPSLDYSTLSLSLSLLWILNLFRVNKVRFFTHHRSYPLAFIFFHLVLLYFSTVSFLAFFTARGKVEEVARLRGRKMPLKKKTPQFHGVELEARE